MGDLTTRYRIDKDAAEVHHGLYDAVKAGMFHGVLVPDEPDYEAAARIYATDYDKDWGEMTEADKDFAIMSVKEYVDAALGANNE